MIGYGTNGRYDFTLFMHEFTASSNYMYRKLKDTLCDNIFFFFLTQYRKIHELKIPHQVLLP